MTDTRGIPVLRVDQLPVQFFEGFGEVRQAGAKEPGAADREPRVFIPLEITAVAKIDGDNVGLLGEGMLELHAWECFISCFPNRGYLRSHAVPGPRNHDIMYNHIAGIVVFGIN